MIPPSTPIMAARRDVIDRGYMLRVTAVAFALLMGQNGATVTVFWHPHRVDMSFNLVLTAVVLLFLLLYLALRSLALLRSLPQQARQWPRRCSTRAHRCTTRSER